MNNLSEKARALQHVQEPGQVPDRLLELTSTNCRFEVLAKLNGRDPAGKLAMMVVHFGPHTSVHLFPSHVFTVVHRKSSARTCDIVLTDVEVSEVKHVAILRWQCAAQGVHWTVQKGEGCQLFP